MLYRPRSTLLFATCPFKHFKSSLYPYDQFSIVLSLKSQIPNILLYDYSSFWKAQTYNKSSSNLVYNLYHDWTKQKQRQQRLPLKLSVPYWASLTRVTERLLNGARGNQACAVDSVDRALVVITALPKS